MKNKATKFKRRDIVGNGSGPSGQEILTAQVKKWWRQLGYCSIFATVPALLLSDLPGARAGATKNTGVEAPERNDQRAKGLNRIRNNHSLLKRQSEFRLHQSDGDGNLVTLGGLDECPGRAIPGGTYTAANPFVDSGTTTGANDTVTNLTAYYNYNAHGPDHVYTFVVTAYGPKPLIEVSTTSGTYKPLIYVVDSRYGQCPAGTGNRTDAWFFADTRWDNTAKAALEIQYLPTNVPLHLFIDSAENDSQASGPYTIRMQDVTIAPSTSANAIDGTDYFVRQQYRDFLNREPDPEGLAFWANQITSCGADQSCVEVNRIVDSGAFFLSIEFQESGYLAYRMYKAAFGNLPNAPVPITFNEFVADSKAIGRDVIVRQAGWEQMLENNKRLFAIQFVERARFTAEFPPAMSAQEFVDRLNVNAGSPLIPAERDLLAVDLSAGRRSRAEVLRAIAEHPKLSRAEFSRAFVLMQYFGYLRRNPNDAPDGNFVGYDFWLDKLNRFNGDFIAAEMVKAFLSSAEYRRRFGP